MALHQGVQDVLLAVVHVDEDGVVVERDDAMNGRHELDEVDSSVFLPDVAVGFGNFLQDSGNDIRDL